ncbi:hypothetical protein [Kocuria aegyptia]|uniref:Uncharacterized protein n=1 Tax=Kocuria aegyptia TaxID=330943 RepID=A0ABN2K322_9MICC
MDNPAKNTSLVENTKAFVTVIAEAGTAPGEQQKSAVREACTAGRPKRPAASWSVGARGRKTGEAPSS